MWQLPITLPDGTPLFFNPNFPFQDLNKLNPKHFGRNVMTSISPFIKVPLELMAGVDVYRKKPIERYKGYRAPVPGIVQNLAKVMPESARGLLGIEKDDRGLLRMDPYVAHAMANLIPFINTSARMLAQDPSPMKAERYLQALSYDLGIKIKPVDPLVRQYETTLEKIEEQRGKLKKLGVSARWNPYKKEYSYSEIE